MVLDPARRPGDGGIGRAGAGPLGARRGHPDLRGAAIDHVTMMELTSSPVLARSVDRDLAGTQDGPHVTTRVDQAGELHQLTQADRRPADLHNGLDRLAGRIAGHHQTVPRKAPPGDRRGRLAAARTVLPHDLPQRSLVAVTHTRLFGPLRLARPASAVGAAVPASGRAGAAAGGERTAAQAAEADLASGCPAWSCAGRFLRGAAGSRASPFVAGREGGVLRRAVRGTDGCLRGPVRQPADGEIGVGPGGARRLAEGGPARGPEIPAADPGCACLAS
jgi:hypothetical protein